MGCKPLVIHKGCELSVTAYRQTAGVANPIPATYQATMYFAGQFDLAFTPFTLTSSPAAGLTIDYAAGSIAIYMGATFTATLPDDLALVWQIDIYDPANPDTVIFTGKGTAVVDPSVA